MEIRNDLRERVRSGIAAGRKWGVIFGRRPGQRVKVDRFRTQSAEACQLPTSHPTRIQLHFDVATETQAAELSGFNLVKNPICGTRRLWPAAEV
jgi:hypothetical protein